MKKRESIWRFGSTFRVGLFALSVIVMIIYLVRDPAFSRFGYIVLGLGLMGLMHEVRQWRINRMPEQKRLSEKVSAAAERHHG